MDKLEQNNIKISNDYFQNSQMFCCIWLLQTEIDVRGWLKSAYSNTILAFIC